MTASAVDRFTWERAVRATPMDPSIKLAALILATYASQNGTKVRPGLRRLSEDAGLSQRTMQRAMVALRSKGLLDRISKGSNLGVKDMVDVYQLVIPAGNQVTPMSLGNQVTPTSPCDTHVTDQVTPVTQPGDTHVHLPSHDQVNYHTNHGSDPLEGLGLDDEGRAAFIQSLKDQGVRNPGGLLRTLSPAEISSRVAEHVGAATTDQWQRAKANSEMDSLWARIVSHHGQDKAMELRDQREADLAPSYPNGVPKRALLMDLIIDLNGEVKAS